MSDQTTTTPAAAATRVALSDLTEWLPRQRWFSAKDRPLADATATDAVEVDRATSTWLVVVTTGYDDGGPEDRWLLALTAAGEDADPLGHVDDVPVVDITARPGAATALLGAARTHGVLTTLGGQTVRSVPVGEAPAVEGGATGRVRAMGVEQSNTSLVVGDGLVVKVIRKLEPGPNPDIEITAELTRERFRGVPALLGAITGPDDEAMVTVAAFVAGARGAWELATDEAAGVADHGIGARMRALGALTAELHAELRDVLPTLDAQPVDTERWHTALRAEAERTRAVLAARAPAAAAAVPAAVEDAIADAPATLGQLQRIHGDYHLGQVLLDREGSWWILDFEGEPARPIAERRQPANPAKDVAGMLRSLDYARAQAVLAGGDPTAAAAWADAARADFLAGYGDAVLPWLGAFEVEKLLYEIRYEAANRPDWLGIPLAALGIEEAPAVNDQTDPTTPSTTPASQPTAASPPASSSPPTPPPRRSRGGAAVPAPPGVRAPAQGGEATGGEVAAPATPVGEETAGASDAAPSGASDPVPSAAAVDADASALAEGRLHEPHRLLGYHRDGDGWVVRAWRPGASSVAYLATPDADEVEATERVPGLFEARVADQPEVGRYRLRVAYPEGGSYDLVDPYSFEPTLGEIDRHLMSEGRHEQAWTVMGANRRTMHGITGVGFAVWAPNARAVRVIGDFNSWDGRLHPMRSLGSSGIWEVFIPDVADGAYYKYELVTADGSLATRADPWAKWAEVPPGQASRVYTSTYEPEHPRPDVGQPHDSPMSIYEVHLASWRHGDGQPLSYRDLAHELGAYLDEMGFTHVEFLPPAEHPFGGSWGYQVTGQFAPTSRFGSPDDFRYLVDHLHGLGIGVIVDWVPAHFPKDEWALRRFDGTALYEHEDPRLGEHPDWGTMVFNYGRTEVRNFITASALFWIEEMGVDALRVDAVASMLYLDYSREEGQWIPNEYGGRENLRAVELLQEVNATVYKRNPAAFTVAEESTAWPGVSRPTHLGGLGFGFKWNMGWMHDTLSYFSKDPIYRRWHHNQLTFGLMYAFSENFVLPLSHDEVVHGKGSLIGKMPGDRWQQFANLRALYGWMWGHPGKQLLFMGGEFGQDREWSEERSLDWHLVEEDWGPEPNRHAGLQKMVADLNAAYRSLPALWRKDVTYEGFSWIDANNADANLLSFARHGEAGDPDVVVIANLSPAPQHGVRIGLPSAGHWDEVFNTDSAVYGGGNVGNMGGVTATDQEWHGMPASALVTCPPLAVIWLRASG